MRALQALTILAYKPARERDSVKDSDAKAPSSYHLQLPYLFLQKSEAACHLSGSIFLHTQDVTLLIFVGHHSRKGIGSAADQ